MSQTIQAGILVIGAGAAGSAAAAELREIGYHGRLTLVNGEAEAPYNRTAVNKGLLQDPTALGSVTLRLPEDDAVTLWHGRRVTHLDPRAGVAHLDSGEQLVHDAVLVTTGATPRSLAVPHTQQAAGRITTLRTAADAARLRAALTSAARLRGDLPVRVGVVGAGLLGAETADTLASEGAVVTLMSRDRAPLDRLLGQTVGGWVRARQHEKLSPAFGTSVLGVHLLGDALLIRLSDGSQAIVDLVLVTAGVTATVDCLAARFVAPGDGLTTDDRLRVLGLERVYAAGDVARFPRGDTFERGEHWGHALAQGRHAARVLLHDLGRGADPGPFTAADSFATRLHGKAVTVLGRPGPDRRELVLAGASEDDAVTIGFVDHEARLTGAVALGSPRALNVLRPLVQERGTAADARAALGDLVATRG